MGEETTLTVELIESSLVIRDGALVLITLHVSRWPALRAAVEALAKQCDEREDM